MKSIITKLLILVLALFTSCCSEKELESGDGDDKTPLGNFECDPTGYTYERQEGCDGKIYPNPDSSLYVIPFLPGTTFKLGLSNCS